MKKKLLSFLLNPFVLAAIISLVIIWFLPEYFSKYEVTFDSTEYINGDDNIAYYSDLDGDGKSEKIIVQTNNLGNASYLVYRSNGDFIDQYNFDGKFSNRKKSVWFQDCDTNGKKEIYFITRIRDSLFLNIHDSENLEGLNFKKVFVDSIIPYEGTYNFGDVAPYEGFDPQNLDHQEVIFTLSTGFSCYPRKAYRFDKETYTITASPHLTNSANIGDFYDLNSDGKFEYLMSGNSPGNDNAAKFSNQSDYSTWVSVLDHNLQFLFPQIEIPTIGSINLIPNDLGDGESMIGYFNSKKYDNEYSRIFRLDLSGKFTKELKLPRGNYSKLVKKTGTYILYDAFSGRVIEFDPNLELLDEIELDSNLSLYQQDLNFDGKEEWIGVNSNWDKVTVWDYEFKHPVYFNPSEVKEEKKSSGVRLLSKNELQLYFHRGKNASFYSYDINPLYNLRYLIYLVIYGLVLLLMWLILQGQKLREAKKQAIEQEISELQLKTIKNQVDPHFVFNAINTISEMTLMDNKLEADQFICEFSDLMRKTLNSSDKITISLEDELAYVENYLRLQQIRHNYKFDFGLQVNEKVNLKLLIPKHSIYTFVENAVKYGLPRDKQGQIKISVVLEDKGTTVFSIEDNGKGLDQSVDKRISTGKGLGIIQQIFNLYTKRFGTNINYTVTDIVDKNKTVIGTRVVVKMRSKKIN